jgi:hypothetical protein
MFNGFERLESSIMKETAFAMCKKSSPWWRTVSFVFTGRLSRNRLPTALAPSDLPLPSLPSQPIHAADDSSTRSKSLFCFG